MARGGAGRRLRRRSAPPLGGDTEADVAIVGGGFTGLWTALALKAREPASTSCCSRPTSAAAGRAGATAASATATGRPAAAARALRRRRRAGGGAGGEAIVPGVRAFAEEAGDDVWLREGGMLRVSAAPAQDHAVGDEVEAARELGVPDEAVALSREELAGRISSPVFREGVLLRDGATVQPARLVLALRRAALDAGSPARADARHQRQRRRRRDRAGPRPREGGRRRGQRGCGRLEAAAPPGDGLRLLRRAHRARAGAARADRLDRGRGVLDGRMFLHYFRTTNDGRVLMGSGSGPIGFGGKIDARFTQDARDGRAGRARAAAPAAGARRGAKVSTPGAGRSTSPPTICRSSARCPRRGFTTAPATRATASARAGSAGRSWRWLVLGVDDE